jgi:hypothetical protein
MYASPPSEAKTTERLRRSIEELEALDMDWGTAVIATAQRHNARLMDVIVVAPRVDDDSPVRL